MRTQISNALYWALKVPEHRQAEVIADVADRIAGDLGKEPGETLEFILKLGRAVEAAMEAAD